MINKPEQYTFTEHPVGLFLQGVLIALASQVLCGSIFIFFFATYDASWLVYLKAGLLITLWNAWLIQWLIIIPVFIVLAYFARNSNHSPHWLRLSGFASWVILSTALSILLALYVPMDRFTGFFG